MHPMFIQLFIETGPDDWPAGENRRRRARRSRRARPALAVRPSVRNRQHRSRPWPTTCLPYRWPVCRCGVIVDPGTKGGHQRDSLATESAMLRRVDPAGGRLLSDRTFRTWLAARSSRCWAIMPLKLPSPGSCCLSPARQRRLRPSWSGTSSRTDCLLWPRPGRARQQPQRLVAEHGPCDPVASG